jgi:hypothetical protein
MRNARRALILGATLAALGLSEAEAASLIPGLWNTGVNALGHAMPDEHEDLHYVILSSSLPGYEGQRALTYNPDSYLQPDEDSAWIAIAGGDPEGPDAHVTTYRLVFSLADFDPATVQVSGRWGADDIGAIFLNGVFTGYVGSGVAALTPFTLTHGFLQGENTLDFQITDYGPPTAFRVDDLGGVGSLRAAVPEPAAWAMMLTGFLGMGALLRRRRLAVSV